MIRENKLLELYTFAVKYARSFRSQYVEVEDLAHEMMVAVMKARWRDDAYATRIMRNRFMDLARRGKLERGVFASLDCAETKNSFLDEESKWDARITVDRMLLRLPEREAKVLRRMLQGESVGVSRMTAYRYVKKARELVIRGGQ